MLILAKNYGFLPFSKGELARRDGLRLCGEVVAPGQPFSSPIKGSGWRSLASTTVYHNQYHCVHLASPPGGGIIRNMSQSIVDTLIKAGFEPIVADIYLILINNGELSVPEILEHTTLSRASVYEALPELLAGGYIEYRKEGRQAFYKPAHPNQLASLVEQKKRDVALLDGEMGETIRALVGSYNLSSNKPGVRFFEGEEGFRDVLFDSLTSSEPIRTIADIEAAHTFAPAINQEYTKKRELAGIHNKILVLDTPFSKTFATNTKTKLVESKFLSPTLEHFHTSTQIYDNKVVYMTLRENNMISVVIEDPDIYQMNKSMFDYLWLSH